MRRFDLNEVFQNDSMNLMSKFKSKKCTLKDYDGNNHDPSNLFKIRADGQISVTVLDKCIYLERWNQPLTSSRRFTKLINQMNNKITMINVDFVRDFVVSADYGGNLMIQKMCSKSILFANTQFFKGSTKPIYCSSIFGNYLCVGSNNYNRKNIGIVDLKTFTKVPKLDIEFDDCVSSVNICKLQNQIFVIATSGKLLLYGYIFLHEYCWMLMIFSYDFR